MHDLKQYIGTKTAIHCPTQEEWNGMLELAGEYKKAIQPEFWEIDKANSCVCLEEIEWLSFSPLSFYKTHGYTILPASDFLEAKEERFTEEQRDQFAVGFAEWVGKNYVRLHSVWVHRYAPQTVQSQWRTTSELLNLYKERK